MTVDVRAAQWKATHSVPESTFIKNTHISGGRLSLEIIREDVFI